MSIFSKNSAKKWIVHFLALSVICSVGSFLYFSNHAWGTWGDDSAGYIFLAGRFHQEQPLVYNDPLATEGIEFFGDYRLARWLLPTHHDFISPDGESASKYPIGLSLLMSVAASITGTSEGFYIVTPGLAVFNLVLMYLLIQLFLPTYRYRSIIGMLAAFVLGFSNLYFEHAVAQPMREIPSITFLLLAALFFTFSLLQHKKENRFFALFSMISAGLSFGMAVNIRETSLIILPGFLFFGLFFFWEKQTLKKYFYSISRYVFSFLIAFCIGVLPTIINSYTISKNKEAFKPRDISGVAIFSNDNHIQSLRIEHLFDNQGKFAAGEGSLPHYWQVLQNISPLPYFLLFIPIGVWFLWRKDRWGKGAAVFLLLWGLSTVFLFSLWINPYARYILPALPPLILLGAIGVYASFTSLIPSFASFFSRPLLVKRVLISLVSVTIVFSYLPFIDQIKREFALEIPYMRFKAITQEDLRSLVDLGSILKSSSQEKEPILLFSGEWQYGVSETFEAHTGVKAIRSPFEQARVTIPFEKSADFLKDRVLSKRYLYIWIDDSTSEQTDEWFQKQKMTLIKEYHFSFEESVSIYKIEL